ETVLDRPERLPLPATDRAPEDAPVPEASSPVPARVLHEGRALNVRRAWADDGRGLPLELTDDTPGTDGAVLRAARLDAARRPGRAGARRARPAGPPAAPPPSRPPTGPASAPWSAPATTTARRGT